MNYIRISETIENAIMKGNKETLRQALPRLTGHELDQNGFPLLYLAAMHGQSEIFQLLLDSGKFSVNDQGLNALCPASRQIMEAIGFIPDKKLDEQWGNRDTDRLSLLDHLARELSSPRHRRVAADMIEALLGGLKEPVIFDNSHYFVKLAQSGLEELVLDNPHVKIEGSLLFNLINDTNFCGYKLPVEKLEAKLEQVEPKAVNDIVWSILDNSHSIQPLLHSCGHKLTNEQLHHWLREALSVHQQNTGESEEAMTMENLQVFIDYLRPATLPDAIKLELATGAVYRGYIYNKKTDDPIARNQQEILNQLWPDIDPGALATSDYGFPARTILHRTVIKATGSSGHVEAKVFFIKLTDDPRFALPPETLARTYLDVAQDTASSPRNGRSSELITELRGFNPNGRIDDMALPLQLIRIFAKELRRYTSSSEPEKLINVRTNLLSALGVIKRRSPLAATLNLYITDNSNGGLENATQKLADSLQWHLDREKAPDTRISPEQLQDPQGPLADRLYPLAVMGLLPKTLKLEQWCHNLKDVAAYEHALRSFAGNNVPGQITQCLNRLGDIRITLSRAAAARATKSSHLSRYLSGNSGTDTGFPGKQ